MNEMAKIETINQTTSMVAVKRSIASFRAGD
jgi:hypothetical protein